jgi:hypothetical protein
MAKIPTLLLVAACVSGCVSVVDVKKLAPKDKATGITYYLPQVFLVVSPARDGTTTVEPVYLPDPAHRYSVSAYSVLGNYTIDVKRTQEGFLDTVTFNSDSTGTAKQLLASGADYRAAEIESGAASAKDKAAEDKAAADKAAADLAAAAKAEADAALAVQVAQSRLDYLNSLAGTVAAPDTLRDQIAGAGLALREAQVRHGAALLAQGATADRYKSANAPGSKGLQAPEPVFLKVSMTEDSVALTRAFEQSNRDTWKIPVEAKDPVMFEVLPREVVMRPAARTGALSATVRSTVPVVGYLLTSMNQDGVEAPLAKSRHPVTGLQSDRTSVQIDLPKDTSAGNYTLDYTFYYMEGDAQKGAQVTIAVKVEK